MLAESSCAYTKIKQIEYYSNEENYIEVTGTISHVVFDDEYKTLYLGFSDLSDTFADNTFELTGRNYSIVADAARESIEVGRTATFVTAPRYFLMAILCLLSRLQFTVSAYLNMKRDFQIFLIG